MIITSTEPRFPADQKKDIATSEALKGVEAAQEKAQKKASEVLAERLPGLIDPNLPADQQPLNDSSNPNPVSRPPVAIHPDRFTPGVADQTGTAPSATAAPTDAAPKKPATSAKPPATAPAKPDGDASPRRNQ
jgi:rod shape-determining protein MreC